MKSRRSFIDFPERFARANPQLEHCAIRINPNRSGEETILRILRESIASI